ncbi:MAG TPA: CHAT domain-containing protein [Candidatus Angelobacter sp.]|nr:CHAT domain-containing protein [Candidatus Angelobacter sp.]
MKIVPAFTVLAVAILAIVQGPYLMAKFELSKAKNNVAIAFATRRTTAMRLTSVPYSQYNPFSTQLGGSDGRGLAETPPEIDDAISAAKKNLKNNKLNPQWLQVQGRALLWVATPANLEKAEKDFENARAEGLDTPSLEIDLAASYYERDSRADHPNLQQTLNLLSEVLSRPKLDNEDRASALYNMAIALEKSEQWDRAESVWKDYLKVDSSSGWAAEARKHLKDVQGKTSEKKRQSYADPSFFLQQLDEGDLKSEDPETYQQRALSHWLPIALKDEGSHEYRALRGLAQIFAEREHQDLWWTDFLARTTKTSDLTAVQELSGAAQSNEQGKYDQAVTRSRSAATTFKSTGNIPGELMARLQETYALRSMLQGTSCLARADPLWEESSRTQYQWLKAQLALEKAQCHNFHGDLGESDSDSQVSYQIAQQSQFPVLEMRILGISASMHSQQGHCDKALDQATQGLERYWGGEYPGERLDQFYAVLWQCAQQSGSLYIAEATLLHTLELRQDPQKNIARNLIREGLLHLRLRNMFIAQRRTELADSEDKKASALLEKIPEPYAKEYRMIIEIEPAELQLQQGDPNRALATLKPVGDHLNSIQDNFISTNYYRLLGNIEWELKQLDQAATAYQEAIDIAEASLESLKGQGDRLAWLRATDESYRGLVRVLIAKNKADDALTRWEWYKARPLLQGLRSGDNRTPGATKHGKLAAQKTQEPSSATLRVIYANFKDGIQIWISGKQGKRTAWVNVQQQEFERVVRSFIEHCTTPDSSLAEIQDQGQWLYEKLLRPVLPSLLTGRPITVELDQSANNLVLEALPDPSGIYFGKEYSVIYSPGMGLEKDLRPVRPIVTSMPLLLLDASHAPGAGYLPGLDAQRSTVLRLFPRAGLVDSTKTELNVLHARMAGSELFLYMGHGRLDGTGTSLDYNAIRSLRAKDFAPDLLRRMQLAVLAACSTGSDPGGLLDTNSLVHAFLAAGVPIVIASHWNVDSETTSELMIAFYQYLAQGKEAAQAMCLARAEVLKSRPHPYYWAAFTVTGRA